VPASDKSLRESLPIQGTVRLGRIINMSLRSYSVFFCSTPLRYNIPIAVAAIRIPIDPHHASRNVIRKTLLAGPSNTTVLQQTASVSGWNFRAGLAVPEQGKTRKTKCEILKRIRGRHVRERGDLEGKTQGEFQPLVQTQFELEVLYKTSAKKKWNHMHMKNRHADQYWI
jgi:hypothetical protein